MKAKIKAAAKGAALGAALIAIASILWGCETTPDFSIEGQFGEYTYSAKQGIVVKPYYPIRIRRDK